MPNRIFKFWGKPETWHRYKDLLLSSEIDYILSCQNIHGGFSNTPYNPSYLETCYYSLVTLGLSNSENLCNDNILGYILSHNCSDGGFGDQPGSQRANIFNTFYAIVCLAMLDSLNRVRTERVVKFILTKFNEDGGFSEHENDPSSLIHTYWCILTLDILNSQYIINKNLICRFLNNCKAKNGLYSNYPNSNFGYLEYTAYAIIIDSVLSLNIDFEKVTLISQIENRSQEDGFSSYNIKCSNYSDTFWGFYLLRYLNMSESFNENLIKSDSESVWNIFLSLILRLYYNNTRVIPNKFLEINIVKPKNEIVNYLKERDFKNYQEASIIGFELFKLLKLEEKHLLKENFDNGILLQINPDVLDLLWENILINDKLLQLGYPVIRMNQSRITEIFLESTRCLIIYDSSQRSSLNEKEAIGNILSGKGIETNCIPFENCDIFNLNINEFQIIHFSGHCEDNMILLMKVKVEVNEILNELISKAFKGLLIMNICNDSINYLKQCQIVNYSVLSFFGTLTGKLGYDLITDFYRNLVSNNNISESLRLAKIKLIFNDLDNVNYLKYLLWGNPNLYI